MLHGALSASSDLGPGGERACKFQLGVALKRVASEKEPTVALQSFVCIRVLLTHWQKSAGIFLFAQERKLTLGDAKCSTSVV